MDKTEIIKKLFPQILAAFILLTLFFGLVPGAYAEGPDETDTIAEWMSPTVTDVITATDGEYKEVSTLKIIGTSSTTLNQANSAINRAGGFDGRAGMAYWLMTTCSEDYENIEVSWNMRSTATGPRDFKLQYSTDNITWNDANDPSITVGSALNINDPASVFSKSLPAGANDAQTLYVRLLLTSDTAANGGTIASSGTNSVNNIVITGEYIMAANQLFSPLSDTFSGAVPSGQVITFTPRPQDESIMGYAVMVSDNNGATWGAASGNQYTVSSLPLTLQVKATAPTMIDSRVNIYRYTQAKLPAVTADPDSGDVIPETTVTLDCSVSGAVIKYKINDGAEETYSVPLTLSESLFIGSPEMLTIEAQAEKFGYITGDSTIFTYTKQYVAPTPIADAWALPAGTVVVIEGIATSNIYSGDAATNTGFFDCIYVQDDTGGINLFPVALGVAEGQKIRVAGALSSYRGETQIAVTHLQVIDAAVHKITPVSLSTEDATDPANTGWLVTVAGTVSDIKKTDDLINQFTVTDASGVEVLVYIDAYITNVVDLSFVEEDAVVSVAGFTSVGENLNSADPLPRIRVRDRGEIELIAAPPVYTVTVIDSYAVVSGAGDYSKGESVQIDAGSRSGSIFDGWMTTSNGVVFADASSATTSFEMPKNNVDVTALWSAQKSSSGGGRGFGKAVIIGESGDHASGAPALDNDTTTPAQNSDPPARNSAGFSNEDLTDESGSANSEDSQGSKSFRSFLNTGERADNVKKGTVWIGRFVLIAGALLLVHNRKAFWR